MFKEIKSDLPASIIVFFVALPLCLGIALASGAPLFSGVIAGIIGGIVVGAASGSQLGVSGPAAGLAVIVLTAIERLGSWEALLLAVVIAGVFQVIMGYAKAGLIAYFFPSSVIKGMLTGIGLLILLKQIPHALGYDKDLEGDLSFFQDNGENTLSAIGSALDLLTPAAVLISVLSLLILILWEVSLSKKHKFFQLLQGPIVVIFFGIFMDYLFSQGFMGLSLSSEHLVRVPVPDSIASFFGQFSFPDFSAITRFSVWETGFVMAIVASLETLLCVEAADKLDPYKRVTPTNRELKAQGLGNIISGLIGGLPITQVIVRSSANISFGGKTKLSGILHGFFLLLSAVTISNVLNMIPLASLAAILILVGYKLAKPKLFKEMYALGQEQYVPFFATVVGILAMDLLKGITVGMALGIFYTLKNSYKNSHSMEDLVTLEGGVEVHHLVLAQNVSFFNKASILKALSRIPKDTKVIIDYVNSQSIALDVTEIIDDFMISAKEKNILVEKINIAKA